jgi:hypothetical protein
LVALGVGEHQLGLRPADPGRVDHSPWAAPLVGALRRSGAQVVAGGRIPHEDLLDALTAAGSVA